MEFTKEGILDLQISVRNCGDVTVLDLRGRSTTNDCESGPLTKHLRELAAQGKGKLLLNLVDLSHVDSCGVNVIVETFVSLKREGGELKLLSPRGRVLEVLTLLRLLDVIPSFGDEKQALASFQPRSSAARL